MQNLSERVSNTFFPALETIDRMCLLNVLIFIGYWLTYRWSIFSITVLNAREQNMTILILPNTFLPFLELEEFDHVEL